MPELTTQDTFAWLDALAAVWDIDNGRGGTVRSFRVFQKNELPNAITPGMAPCAISYPGKLEIEYSLGGPSILWWTGQTEFHLTEDCKPANLAYILPYYVRIIKAAAANMTLGGLVESFMLLRNDPEAIQKMTYLNADGSDGHEGLLVKWKIKHNISGLLTCSL